MDVAVGLQAAHGLSRHRAARNFNRQRTGVTVWETSANRDADAFENLFRFDVGRDRNNHVGFGLGAHFCLGANLARLEIRVMFEELLNRFDHFELDAPLAWMNNNRLVGLTELPVKAFPR